MMKHPSVDGNKRIGTAAALIFLYFHGYWVEISDEKLEELALQAAGGQHDKEAVAPRLRPFVVTPPAAICREQVACCSAGAIAQQKREKLLVCGNQLASLVYSPLA